MDAQRNQQQSLFDRQIILQAQVLSRLNSEDPKDLRDIEFSAFSQWGEDGILNWIVSKIPEIPRFFVEFGVEDYREANTRLLLIQQNWSGLVMDGSQAHINEIRSQEIYWRHQLTAEQCFIDCNNINEILKAHLQDDQVGVLSVDIDGNDYWVWKEINCINPAVVVCEYNAVFGDLLEVTVPYRDDFVRGNAHHSNLYFGCSLPALVRLGQEKGYVFIGTNSNGCNAFFVRKDLSEIFLTALNGIYAYPSLFREARAADGTLKFISGPSRVKEINELEVIDLKKQRIARIQELGDLYSSEWLMGIRRKLCE